ncbi:unnamed protein product [Caenorhabditis brenneri]
MAFLPIKAGNHAYKWKRKPSQELLHPPDHHLLKWLPKLLTQNRRPTPLPRRERHQNLSQHHPRHLKCHQCFVQPKKDQVLHFEFFEDFGKGPNRYWKNYILNS